MNENRSAPDLAAIRARCEAATPGPWKPRYDGALGSVVAFVPSIGRLFVADCAGTAGIRRSRDDADFIAHAREDIPALLAALEAAQAEIAALRERAPKAAR